MHKGFLGSVVLVVALGLIFGFCIWSCFAQESITITTYYPSPYGVYNELQTNKMAVGDVNNNGGLDAGDQPPANGQLYTARSVIYKPLSSTPSFDAIKGELVYNGSDDRFYYYNGANWRSISGLTEKITVVNTVCSRSYRVDVYASCPAGYVLSGCAGGAGDISEYYESEHIMPQFNNNRCYLRVLQPRCFSIDSVQMVIAICER